MIKLVRARRNSSATRPGGAVVAMASRIRAAAVTTCPIAEVSGSSEADSLGGWIRAL